VVRDSVEDLRSGEYLVRHETISLHSANKPQFYPDSTHLDVKEVANATPGEKYLVKILGAWDMDLRVG
jgi:hypothetical protein